MMTCKYCGEPLTRRRVILNGEKSVMGFNPCDCEQARKDNGDMPAHDAREAYRKRKAERGNDD